MRFYRFMATMRWPASFRGKLFLICFVSTHIPLLTVLAYLVSNQTISGSLPLVVAVVVATLVGTAIALVGVGAMLEPVRVSSKALRDYVSKGVLPTLPVNFHDDVGLMMRDTQTTLEKIDHYVGQLGTETMSDPMTGARNRRWMNEYGIRQFEDARLKGSQFGLVLVDLDRFKQVNDVYGHAVGDQIILTAADAIIGCVRKRDSVVRLGGDEFCVFMPEASRSDILDVADRIRTAIEQSTRQLGLDDPITASLGGASVARTDKSFLDTYQRADKNLYAAKAKGRNMVHVEIG